MKKLIPVFGVMILLIVIVFFLIAQTPNDSNTGNKSFKTDSFENTMEKEPANLTKGTDAKTKNDTAGCYSYDFEKEECVKQEECVWREEQELCEPKDAEYELAANQSGVNESEETNGCYKYDFSKEDCLKQEECTWNENQSICVSLKTYTNNQTTTNENTTTDCYQYDFNKEGCLEQEKCEWNEEKSLCTAIVS